jgi:hypothetical protein
LITLAHLATSALKKAPNCSGLPATASVRSRASGSPLHVAVA